MEMDLILKKIEEEFEEELVSELAKEVSLESDAVNGFSGC